MTLRYVNDFDIDIAQILKVDDMGMCLGGEEYYGNSREQCVVRSRQVLGVFGVLSVRKRICYGAGDIRQGVMISNSAKKYSQIIVRHGQSIRNMI